MLIIDFLLKFKLSSLWRGAGEPLSFFWFSQAQAEMALPDKSTARRSFDPSYS